MTRGGRNKISGKRRCMSQSLSIKIYFEKEKIATNDSMMAKFIIILLKTDIYPEAERINLESKINFLTQALSLSA
jgi:hypothetical protein